MKDNTTAKVRTAIADMMQSYPEAGAEQITKRVQKNEPELLAKWLDEKCAAVFKELKRKAKPNPDAPYQMLLFGLPSLSLRLPVEDRRVELRNATLKDLKERLKELNAHRRVTPTRQAVQLTQLIEAMRPIARVHRGITVQRYCELAAARSVMPPTTKGAKKKT